MEVDKADMYVQHQEEGLSYFPSFELLSIPKYIKNEEYIVEADA